MVETSRTAAKQRHNERGIQIEKRVTELKNNDSKRTKTKLHRTEST
jgi:hypothetical protein